MSDDRVTLTRQVKEASDIVAVVGSYLAVHPAGGIYKAICPFHNDTRPSLQIDPKWQNFRCWACGKKGDVFTFVAEFEKVTFKEAREILARRAGISLEGSPAENVRRGKLLDAMKWAEAEYQECLLLLKDIEYGEEDRQLGERARLYLAERKLSGPIIRSFGLGYAPASGNWLVRRANAARMDMGILKEVGLTAERSAGAGFFDRFRDRVMFPIRDARGQTVGFGGRILPDSPFADRGPKYYNSSETPLFLKKELLYGLDAARHAGATEGYLAVVEGYTDVMMAHQHGVTHVVATMGTALNEAHVRQLRRFVPRVVLVFDADAGGLTGVDRALEIFVGCDVELAIATLPEGLDPCDFLVAQGADPFRRALAEAVDALDFKVNLELEKAGESIEGRAQALKNVLNVMARSPHLPESILRFELQLTPRQQMLLNRLSHRFGIAQERVIKEFAEARKKATDRTPATPAASGLAPEEPRRRPARKVESELLQILLADPGLVQKAYTIVRPEDLEHPGLQQLLGGLYQLFEGGDPPTLDGLREFVENRALIEWAIDAQEVGQKVTDRQGWFEDVLARLRKDRKELGRRQLMDRLRAAATDDERQRLLRDIQDLDREPGPTGSGPS